MFSSLPSAHPFLVHFPIALFTVALLFDVVVLVGCSELAGLSRTSRGSLRFAWLDRAALTLYGIASGSALATAVTGKLSADALPPGVVAEALEIVGRHGDWAFLTVLLLFGSFFFRVDVLFRERGGSSPRASRARLAAIFVVLLTECSLLVTAGLGGELVYRYGVGVSSQPRMESR